ncbi:MAG: hypothetical protein NC394_08850 [Bacteroides sp.]|nr:hypothetical protein [Bacteroides sp.]
MENTNSILEMARGAIMEQVNVEVGRVVNNILDPNTDPKKKRSLTLTFEFLPSADRTQVGLKATAKSKLEPNNAIQTALSIGTVGEQVVAMEMVPQIPGQQSLNGEEQEDPKILKFAVS